ncbi:unnamed protein product [Rhizophagus irregularis]|nr:unnamed protein product [Rhizophagus irregularis]
MSHEKINSREKSKFLFKIIFFIIIVVIILSFTTEIKFTTSPIINNDIKTTITKSAPTNATIKPILSFEEKFLTYLPHNDFHDQHGALINAIMLSYITNRTLIIPPLLINYFPRTSTFHSLYNNLNKFIEIKKYREEHCYIDDENEENSLDYCDNEYSQLDDFTMINWEQLFDFNELKKHVKMINRGFDFSLDNLKYNFNIGENDTYLFIEDLSYELKDNDNSIRKNDKKLLHFSSLLGPNKIILENQNNIKFRQLIHNKLVINNPKILNVSEKIIEKLGGKGNYIGLHIEIRHKTFRINANYNIDLIYRNLMKHLLNSNLLRNSKNFFNYNLKECLKNNIPIIYIATDSFEPRSRFSKLYENIPCIFTLFDLSKDLDNFGKIPSEYDEDVDLTNFYVPIIDLLITAHGKTFIGIPKSAFSRLANEVNNLSNGKNAIS